MRISRACFLAILLTGIILTPVRPQEEERYQEKRLSAGDTFPVLEFEDIHRKKGSTADYRDWIVVFSFADRNTHKPLMEWIDKAWEELRDTGLEVKTAFVNVADLVTVPTFLRGVVTPLLRILNEKSMKSLRESYEKRGIDFNSVANEVIFIPDYTGDILFSFGLRDGKKWHSFVTLNHEIGGVFDASHTNRIDQFIKVTHDLASSVKQDQSENGVQ